jgi:hypothetical protein
MAWQQRAQIVVVAPRRRVRAPPLRKVPLQQELRVADEALPPRPPPRPPQELRKELKELPRVFSPAQAKTQVSRSGAHLATAALTTG